MARRKKIKGLGDLVSTVADFIGVQPCQACLERQAKWNTMFPIKLKPRELTEDELQQYRDFQKIRTLRLSYDQRKWLCKIYSDVFKVSYYEPCTNCDASPYIRMIERMDKIVGTYENE